MHGQLVGERRDAGPGEDGLDVIVFHDEVVELDERRRPLRRTGPPARDRRPLWRNWVDALDLKSSSARSAGSIPARGTIGVFS